MRQMENNRKVTRRSTRMTILVAALFALGLLVTSSASAAYEQVGCFAGAPFAGAPGSDPCKPVAGEKFSEEVQLGAVGGMAVNINGTPGPSGVPAGTVYAATRLAGFNTRVAVYFPVGGTLQFEEAWKVPGLKEPYERCGPLLGTEVKEGKEVAKFPCFPGVSGSAGSVDVDIDAATGNVYVFTGEIVAGRDAIVIYNPDGSKELTRFGEIAPGGKPIAETSENLHNASVSSGAIAVNDEGHVWAYDLNGFDTYRRLMEFEPKTPGNYEEYKYAGTSHDIFGGFGGFGPGGTEEIPNRPVLDAAGNIYVANESTISEYDTKNPGDPPTCKFKFAKAGITGMTVNPETGEVFFFGLKKEGGFSFKLVHQLSPCDEETGEFHETGKFEVKPERDDLWGLAFDPVRQLDPSRPPGVLYGGAPAPIPNSGVGSGEPGQSSLGYIFTRPVELAPVIKSESVAHVTSTTAELRAQIDPKGSEINYAFQYITEAQYEANEPSDRFAGATEAPPGGAVGGSQKVLGVAVALAGLAPDTAYRYRAVASSHCSSTELEKACPGTGPAQAFRTFPIEASGLPDERAYELVSPAQKNGGEVFPASADAGCGHAKCKPGSASTRSPMQSTPTGEAVVYEGFPFSFTEGAVSPNEYVARRDPNTGWQTTTLSPKLLSGGLGAGGAYKAFDTELSKGVFFQDAPTLSPEAPSGYPNLYAQSTADPLALGPLVDQEPPNGVYRLTFAGASADLSRIFFAADDALSEATAFAPEAIYGGTGKNNLYEWAEGELRLVNVAPGNTETEAGASIGSPSPDSHAVSKDGSRIFWSDQAGQLYVRENGETSEEIPGPGKFLSASVDGSKVLLRDGHFLNVDELGAEPVDLSQGKGGFLGIVGQSEDLSQVYFVDTEVLSGEEENDHGAKAQPGKDNLYSWNEGTLVYVATLLPQDNPPNEGDWAPFPSKRTAQASPGGRWLAFLSRAPLSGYDNTGPCALVGETGGFVDGPCREVFLYDSASGKLGCASCNPSGVAPLGNSSLALISSNGTDASVPQPHYLTEQGRLLFDSADSLSPFDTNEGTVPGGAAEDVYEYEPDGIGVCKRPSGCLNLISAGREPVASNFLAMDENGENVFFTSRDQLVLKDRDDAVDLYDARVHGGIPAETEVARGECQGEACVAALTSPNDPTPGSSSFEGGGNVDERKAAKKHKHKKKHAKKKHAHKRAANHNRGGGK